MNATLEHDEYGREWGKPLWENGPILGGLDWQEFVPRMLASKQKQNLTKSHDYTARPRADIDA